jgi:hypothetical protein
MYLKKIKMEDLNKGFKDTAVFIRRNLISKVRFLIVYSK